MKISVKIAAVAIAAAVSMSVSSAQGVFDFETITSGTALSTRTGDAPNWGKWDSSPKGSSYETKSTTGATGRLTVSGEYTGGVISNSKSNAGKDYMADLDTAIGGASSGNNYGVLYLTTAYARKSTEYGKKTYYTTGEVFCMDSTRDEYCDYIDVFDSQCFLTNTKTKFSTIDVAMTGYTYDVLLNGNKYMGEFDSDEDGNVIYNNITNNSGSFFVIRMYGVIDAAAKTLTENYVDVILAQNVDGTYFFNTDWNKNIDLSSLNGEDGLDGIFFEAMSSFGGGNGINAPAYVAIDNITTMAIPEPSTYAALFGMIALAFVVYNRRPRK